MTGMRDCEWDAAHDDDDDDDDDIKVRSPPCVSYCVPARSAPTR